MRVTDSAWQTVVAVDDHGSLAGLVHFGHNNTMDAASGEIEFLYVDSSKQATGVGTQLILIGESGLRRMGSTTAVLWVYEANTPARAFYDRRGWHWDGAKRESGSAPGNYLLRYAKNLTL